MRTFAPAALAVSFALLVAGCGHVDLTPPAEADRVLNSVVTNNTEAELPAGTEVIVRVVGLATGDARSEVLGEQTVLNPARMPVSVRVEYRAEDALLRRGVNVEARVSVGGRLRYVTTSAHPITPGNVNDTHLIQVVTVANR